MKMVPFFEKVDAKLKDIVDAKLAKIETEYPYSVMKDFSRDKDFFKDIAEAIIDDNPEYYLDRYEIIGMLTPIAGDYFANYVDTIMERERKERVEFVSIYDV